MPEQRGDWAVRINLAGSGTECEQAPDIPTPPEH